MKILIACTRESFMSKLVRLHARDGNQVTSFIHHDDVVKKEEMFFLEIKLHAFDPLGNPGFYLP